MSRTRRKPNAWSGLGPKWRDTSDRKPGYKPGKAVKKAYHKGDKAKAKQVLHNADDFDNMVIPHRPRSDVYRYT